MVVHVIGIEYILKWYQFYMEGFAVTKAWHVNSSDPEEVQGEMDHDAIYDGQIRKSEM